MRALAMLGLIATLCASRAHAKVFLAKDEALALAFPGAERVEERTFILTDAQKAEVERRARAPLESQLWTIYVGWKDGAVQGYAIIDTHTVRTLPETFMAVLDPRARSARSRSSPSTSRRSTCRPTAGSSSSPAAGSTTT